MSFEQYFCEACCSDPCNTNCCCVQMGSSGTFTACRSGYLFLEVNDQTKEDNGPDDISVTLTPGGMFTVDQTKLIPTGIFLTLGDTVDYEAEGAEGGECQLIWIGPGEPGNLIYDLDGNLVSGDPPPSPSGERSCYSARYGSLVGRICPFVCCCGEMPGSGIDVEIKWYDSGDTLLHTDTGSLTLLTGPDELTPTQAIWRGLIDTGNCVMEVTLSCTGIWTWGISCGPDEDNLVGAGGWPIDEEEIESCDPLSIFTASGIGSQEHMLVDDCCDAPGTAVRLTLSFVEAP